MLLPRSNNVCDWLSNVTRRRDTQDKLYVTQRRTHVVGAEKEKNIRAVMCNVVIYFCFIKLVSAIV